MDDLTMFRLARETVGSVLHKVAELAVRSIPGVAEASVTLIEGGRPRTASWTGLLAYELDETQYGSDHGPCLNTAVGGVRQAIPDMATEQRWPGYAQIAVERGCLSSLSIPIPLTGGLQAGLNLYGTSVDAFDGEAEAIAAVLAGRAAVAIGNMHDYERVVRDAEHLQTALDTRAGIEQAKGVLMCRHGITADEAFALLSTQSQHANRKLRDLAAELIESIEEGPVRPDPT